MKKIPWWQPLIGKEEYKLIKSVLKSNFPNEGALSIQFQNSLAKLLNVKHVLLVTNATSGMFLSLKAIGIGPGDEVIVPDLTFIATANAVEMTGAKAVLVDIDPDTPTISINAVKKAINKKTKAIIPVHVSGHSADIENLLEISKKNNIPIIEDAAEAFMSMRGDKYLGTIGLTGCFSLSPAKTITTGQGGFITTNDSKLYEKLIELKDQGRPKRGTGGDDIHTGIGFNFKFTDVQAAIGLGQLSQLNFRIQRLKRNYELYLKYLGKSEHFTLFDFKSEEVPQWSDGIFNDRDNLVKFLNKNNIDTRNYWFPIHSQNYYKQTDNKFPVATKISKSSLWLPSAFTLKDSDIKKVSEYIIRFYEKK